MYTAIACIYVVTSILIIRSDYIKRQNELEKIKSVQERVREELEQQRQKEEDEEAKKKEEEEKENQKKKEKKQKKDKDEKDIPNIGSKPEGSNV